MFFFEFTSLRALVSEDKVNLSKWMSLLQQLINEAPVPWYQGMLDQDRT